MRTQATVETQLAELLHLTHEAPIMMREENCFFQKEVSAKSASAKVVGITSNINLRTGLGLPKHITVAETKALFGVIKANTTIVWHPPLQACKSVAVTLKDRQQLETDDDYYMRVVLRAMPFFHGKPGNDNVKVAVEYDTGDKIHFAKCVLFLRDSLEEYFVLLQWYDEVGRQPLDSVSGLVQLVVRPPNVTRSYSIMPITSIVNGAIITPSENKLWVLLSPRETFAYELTNMSNS